MFPCSPVPKNRHGTIDPSVVIYPMRQSKTAIASPNSWKFKFPLHRNDRSRLIPTIEDKNRRSLASCAQRYPRMHARARIIEIGDITIGLGTNSIRQRRMRIVVRFLLSSLSQSSLYVRITVQRYIISGRGGRGVHYHEYIIAVIQDASFNATLIVTILKMDTRGTSGISALKENDQAPARRRKWDCPICRLGLTARGRPTGSTRMCPGSLPLPFIRVKQGRNMMHAVLQMCVRRYRFIVL